MVERVDSAFKAKREAVGPHSRVRIDHFQSDCFLERFQNRATERVRVRVMTDVRAL